MTPQMLSLFFCCFFFSVVKSAGMIRVIVHLVKMLTGIERHLPQVKTIYEEKETRMDKKEEGATTKRYWKRELDTVGLAEFL